MSIVPVETIHKFIDDEAIKLARVNQQEARSHYVECRDEYQLVMVKNFMTSSKKEKLIVTIRWIEAQMWWASATSQFDDLRKEQRK